MNYYGVTRSTDHLAHYGVKGMRWGVRRAIVTGNQRALDRHYRKAARKLAKLQNIGDNPYKSVAKSAAYGTAAAGMGALALGGTGLAAKGLRVARTGTRGIAKLITGKDFRPLQSVANAANSIDKWGNRTTVGTKLAKAHNKTVTAFGKDGRAYEGLHEKMRRTSNSDYARIGAGVAALGLAAKSYQHARRAKNSEKYREKAERFRDEMDKAFANTEYEGQYAKMSKRQQRRRRGYY